MKNIFEIVDEPYRRIPVTIKKHVEHDQKTHGRRGKGTFERSTNKSNRNRVRDRIKEILTWKNPEGEDVDLIVYPQQRWKYGPQKRSRHTVKNPGLAAVAKQERLDEIAKQLKAKE